MKTILYCFIFASLGLSGCKSNIDIADFSPTHVDKFARDFVSLIHDGQIDSCLSLSHPDVINDAAVNFLENTFKNIRSFRLDTFKLINAQKTHFMGDTDEFTDYAIDYEYYEVDKYVYFSFRIREQNDKLVLTAFNGNILGISLSEIHSFTLNDKGFLHYLFLVISILIPIFILVTIVFILFSDFKLKWLWIIGAIFGFGKFIINWTTGQFMLQPISIMLIGAGYKKSGLVAPWMISFSIPIVAILFWIKRTQSQKNNITKIQNDFQNQEVDNMDTF